MPEGESIRGKETTPKDFESLLEPPLVSNEDLRHMHAQIDKEFKNSDFEEGNWEDEPGKLKQWITLARIALLVFNLGATHPSWVRTAFSGSKKDKNDLGRSSNVSAKTEANG